MIIYLIVFYYNDLSHSNNKEGEKRLNDTNTTPPTELNNFFFSFSLFARRHMKYNLSKKILQKNIPIRFFSFYTIHTGNGRVWSYCKSVFCSMKLKTKHIKIPEVVCSSNRIYTEWKWRKGANTNKKKQISKHKNPHGMILQKKAKQKKCMQRARFLDSIPK